MLRQNPIGCIVCGTAKRVSTAGTAPGWCTKCRSELSPTPLDSYLDALGMTASELSELAGVSAHTISRARSGQPVGARSASRLAKLFRVPPSTFTAPRGAQEPQ